MMFLMGCMQQKYSRKQSSLGEYADLAIFAPLTYFGKPECRAYSSVACLPVGRVRASRRIGGRVTGISNSSYLHIWKQPVCFRAYSSVG
jgi:hypothetical protein